MKIAFKGTIRLVVGLFVLALPVEAAVLYSDDFSTASGMAGTGGRVGFTTAWTGQTGTPTAGTIDIGSNGAQTVFSRTNSDGSPTLANDLASISHSFSTAGFINIMLNLTAFQSNTQFEANFDILAIQYSTTAVASWQSLLIDRGALQNPLADEASSTDGSGQNGLTTPSSSGLLALPAGAANNADFAVRILTRYNASTETYFIDNFELHGDMIPEPASGLLLVAGSGLLLLRRRVAA